ncbi:hypothetical protein [Ferrovibrio sp.]|uniref:hypothetical protein n=1 Tax=Ferrovibrio sp. TaxID=1917215 RepID=UPI0035AFC85F
MGKNDVLLHGTLALIFKYSMSWSANIAFDIGDDVGGAQMNGNFIPDLHELTGDVIRSRYQLYADNLQRWFSHLESDAHALAIISSLEQNVDFASWYSECTATMRGMLGSGKLKWPSDLKKRLGLHLQLFRQFANEVLSPDDFCSHFLYTDNNYSAMVSEINNQIFDPFSRDLIKYLARYESDNSDNIPASDRVVPLDHNSRSYVKVSEALSNVEKLIKESNELSTEDKDLRSTEIAAGKTLLSGNAVRISAIVPVLLKGLQWLAKVFVEQTIGVAATIAITALIALLGFT